MNSWQLQEAKARFSEFLDAALKKGPQVVTRRGVADHDVEIVADRGIATRVPDEEWESLCRDMERAFKDGRFEAGLVSGIGAVANHLVVHFPASKQGSNELPDKPLML